MMTEKELERKKLTLELTENLLSEATKDFGRDRIVELKTSDFETVSVVTESGISWNMSIGGDSPIAIAHDIISTVYSFEVWGKIA